MLNMPERTAYQASLLIRALTKTMPEHTHELNALRNKQPAPDAQVDLVYEAERLLLSGELLLALGHEVNNALTVILSNIELLERQTLPPSAHELTKDVLAAGGYLRSMLDSMLSTGHRATEDHCEFGQVLQTVVKVANAVAKRRNIVIDYSAEKDLWVQLSAHRVQQILVNLLFNSRYVLQTSGGHIWVRAGVDKDEVVITIKDDGPGIPDHVLDHMFEPFFSTKPAGSGTGLGLAIVRNIVQQAGGEVNVIDARPGSTTFMVRLPRAAAHQASS